MIFYYLYINLYSYPYISFYILSLFYINLMLSHISLSLLISLLPIISSSFSYFNSSLYMHLIIIIIFILSYFTLLLLVIYLLILVHVFYVINDHAFLMYQFLNQKMMMRTSQINELYLTMQNFHHSYPLIF
jgi:hypothetical protein